MDAGRLGNVTAVLLLGARERSEPAEAPERLAVVLDGLFEELLRLGGEPAQAWPGRFVEASQPAASPLGLLSDALEAASCERVLVVPADRPTPDVELWLALTAWPEQAAIAAYGDHDDQTLAALYRREDVLPVLRGELARGRGELSALSGCIEVERVTRAMLGLDEEDPGGPGGPGGTGGTGGGRVSGPGVASPDAVVSGGC